MKPEEYKAIRTYIGTQSELAKMLGVSRRTIIKRETGAVKITREQQLALIGLAIELNGADNESVGDIISRYWGYDPRGYR